MDLWQLMLILLRRWFVVIPALLITALIASNASERVDPTYTASATGLVIVLNPAERGNPSTERAAQAASVSVSSAETRDRVASAGLGGDYSVGVRNRTSLIDVSVETDDPQRSATTVQAVLDLLAEEFGRRPQIYGVPPGPVVGLELLAGPSVEGAAYEGRARIIAVVAAVGLVAAVVLAVLVDLLIRSLRKRRTRTARATSTAVEPGAPVDGEAVAPRDHAGTTSRR